jgi:predicted nucleic acid-binding protein
MTVFIDTSALYAVMDRDDKNHTKAQAVWKRYLDESVDFLCHNFILVETVALLQNRIGMDCVSAFIHDVLPVVRVEWVDEEMHQAGLSSLLAASRRRLSLVDCISFDVIRRLGLYLVFAFDPHFREMGFEVL